MAIGEYQITRCSGCWHRIEFCTCQALHPRWFESTIAPRPNASSPLIDTNPPPVYIKPPPSAWQPSFDAPTLRKWLEYKLPKLREPKPFTDRVHRTRSARPPRIFRPMPCHHFP